MSFQDENDDEDLNGGEITVPSSSSAIAVLFLVLFGVALPLAIGLWKWALS